MKNKIILITSIAALLILLASCNLQPPSTPTQDSSQLYTQAAETVRAQFTDQPATPGDSTQPPAITETPTSGSSGGEPTSTPTTAPTSSPTSAAATPTPEDCEDRATFVRDVTIPDDTVILPGETFVKTWRLRNVGTCTWTTDYEITFDSGDLMNAPTTSNLPAAVEPDDEIDLSIELKAPSAPDTYRGNWLLSNASGEKFGIGQDADRPFYLQIVVEEGSDELNLGSPTWTDSMNSGANWYLLDEPNTKFEIEDGNLVMRSINPGEVEEWGLATHGEIDDFYMEMKATTGEDCSGLDRYGLLLRSPDPDEGYVYGFSCDGRFRIYKWDGENYQAIQEWKASPHIKSGPNQTNLLGIWMSGATIRLYANRILLGEYTDNSYDEGRFGLFIGSSETEDLEVYVEEVSYWLLNE